MRPRRRSRPPSPTSGCCSSSWRSSPCRIASARPRSGPRRSRSVIEPAGCTAPARSTTPRRQRSARHARTLLERLRDALRAIRAAPGFRAAVDAHRRATMPRWPRSCRRSSTGSSRWRRRPRSSTPSPGCDAIARARPPTSSRRSPGCATTGSSPRATSWRPEPTRSSPAVALAARGPGRRAGRPPLRAAGAAACGVPGARDGREHLVHVPRLQAPFEVDRAGATIDEPGRDRVRPSRATGVAARRAAIGLSAPCLEQRLRAA